MEFIIDTDGATDNHLSESEPGGDPNLLEKLLQQFQDISSHFPLSNSLEKRKPTIDSLSPADSTSKPAPKPRDSAVAAAMKKCVITPDFESRHAVPEYEVAKRLAQKRRRIEASKTKGKNWYNLPATEVTEEVKRDLEVLQMRSVLDPKRFYKKNDLKVLPKYFQIGTVMDSPADYYSNRLTNKERKKTLVDELMADAEFRKYNKRKYQEVLAEQRTTHYKAHMQAKRLKRKNKK